MMIDVKGTKQEQAQTDPAQRFALKSMDRYSRLPWALGLMLTGLAVYLKTSLSSAARTESDAEVPAERPEGNAAPKLQTVQISGPAVAAAGGGDGQAAGPVGSGSRLFDLQPPAQFTFAESIDIPLIAPEDWGPFQALGRGLIGANDNLSGNIYFHTLPAAYYSAPALVAADSEDGEGEEVDDTIADEEVDAPIADTGAPQGAAGEGDAEPDEPQDGDDPDTDDTDENEADDNDDETAANRAPRVSGPVYLLDVTGCAVLAIGLTDLLANADDPDGDALSVQNLVISSGTLTPSAEGWVFAGEPQLNGLVTITYEITDGTLSVEQTAYFSVVRNSIEGTAGDDMILGSMCGDDIYGKEGADNIDARAGDDVIDGGCGDDHIVAGEGDDTVFAGAGNDIVFGGAGDDVISGGSGNDRLYGEEGDDHLAGDDGDDMIDAGEGADIVTGGAGDDTIFAGTGDDVVYGGRGHDRIYGEEGDDHLAGDDGDDTLDAGDGNNIVSGGAGDDQVTSGGGHDVVLAGAGDDVVFTSAGNDHISGESGNDWLFAGEGDDIIFGNAGDDIIDAGAGRDILDGGDGNDRLSGGADDDVLFDGQGADENLGGSGSDHVLAALDSANDHHDGGDGQDTLDYSQSSGGVTVDLAEGTAHGVEIGEDTLGSFEEAIGGSGDDHFIADDSGAVILAGGEGGDTFEFLQTNNPAPQPLVHEILDFGVGDRIRMSKYDLFEKVYDEFEDRFEDLFGDDIDEDDIPIRYRHDRVDQLNRTVVEADFNDDNIWETTIALQGHRALVIIENA